MTHAFNRMRLIEQKWHRLDVPKDREKIVYLKGAFTLQAGRRIAA